ncbi:hypothetical protein [uncultured Endozoicomonas sp.]|uniref:hypothetical protein n=1 Tax=uncultured Endozoicomonas sp. TaxID=432652 RepID=UPI00260D607C|nr:hypothetical protein [uncultured Endozoicomonas sp.]
MITDFITFTPFVDNSYQHKLLSNITLDGVPYQGAAIIMHASEIRYLYGAVVNGSLYAQGLVKSANRNYVILVYKEGRPFISDRLALDNIVVNEVAISTSGGGGAPTGDPATITGKVERVLDNQALPAARQLVAIENKPDGSWAVTGNTVSDMESGSYTLNVLTDGGDTFVMALDDYGQVFTATASVVIGDVIHPTIPNGHVYSVEVGGTLPETEPQWWEAGSSGTQVAGDVTLRAIPFYRPLVHGYIKASLTE